MGADSCFAGAAAYGAAMLSAEGWAYTASRSTAAGALIGCMGITVRGCIRSVLPLHLLTDLPGDSCGEDNSSGRPESDQPALRTRLTLTANGARRFAEHDSVQAWRWLGTGELVVDVAQVAPISVQQLLEILFAIASRAHDSNLARTRARA